MSIICRAVPAALLGAAVMTCALAAVVAAGNATPPTPTVATVLDLPYGKGANQVGWLPAQAIDPTSPALGPEMFQMMRDGRVWVLDTVNGRLLEFKDGKQVTSLPADAFDKYPSIFGATRSAVFVGGLERRGDMPVGVMWRYDRSGQPSRVIDLNLPDGRSLLPMDILPLGSTDTELLVYGSTYPDDKSLGLVINEAGTVTSVIEGIEGVSGIVRPMAAADGAIWRFSAVEIAEGADVPFSTDRYDSKTKTWVKSAEGALPRRVEFRGLRQRVRMMPLGVDAGQRISVALSEGMPPSVRFMRLSPAGEILAAASLEEVGLESGPLYNFYVGNQCFRLLTDGSILAQYATPERYRIIRLAF